MAEVKTLKEVLKTRTMEGELYEKHPDGSLTCFACGHRCLIKEGRDGICRVRFNQGGKLYVPANYVGALQIDPTEKKPFFHAHPGSLALTFGMLGCDFHCSYCFPGDTRVVTDRGVLPLQEIFKLATHVAKTSDGEIAYPENLRAVARSGEMRRVLKVFKHHYAGPMIIIKPYYLPELRCTPDHKLFASEAAEREVTAIDAGKLTSQHNLVIPRTYHFNESQSVDIIEALKSDVERRLRETKEFYLIPIRSVETENFNGDVYNLEAEEEHNYLANFFLVKNCQNWVTSQALRDPNAIAPPREIKPLDFIALGKRYRAKVIASSYNEPLITSEWAIKVFKEAKKEGFTTGYVSNGNATPEVLEYIRPWTDLYKIDLKSFNDRNYRKLGGVLQHVLDTVKMVYARGFWLEVLTLTIPGFNDSDEELRGIAEFLVNISPDIPWHVTAFHKDYKMTDPDNTPPETLIRAAKMGYDAGLHFVYAGNLPGMVGTYENTYCPKCHTLLVERYGFKVLQNRLVNSSCPECRTKIPGVWE